MAEDLGKPDEELLDSRVGFRLLTGQDRSGAVYFVHEYKIPESVESDLLSRRLENLRALELSGLAPVTEAKIEGSTLRIVQKEVFGASLTTLLKWRPDSVNPERFRKWAFQFCLFLRAFHEKTDWTPTDISLEHLMVTQDGRLVVVSPGWEGLFKSGPSDREATYLQRFRDFTTPLLEHLEHQGHEVTSLYWVFQHRANSLDELRETLDQGAPFIPSSLDELVPLSSFTVPEVEEPSGILGAYLSQSPWRLFVQFGLLLITFVMIYHFTRPTPLANTGVYILTEGKVVLFEPESDRVLGDLKLPATGQALGLLEDPLRLAVAFRGQKKVAILDGSTGQTLDSFMAEGAVTEIVSDGSILCMDQGDKPGVLLYDGEQQKPTRVLLTAGGVTSMAITRATLVVACRDRHRLYAFALPDGELLEQRKLLNAEVLGADSGDCYVSFDAGTKLGRLEAATLKTLKQVSKEPAWDITQILPQSDGNTLWALAPSTGCTLLQRDTLEPSRQFPLPAKATEALLLQHEKTWRLLVCLPEHGSIISILSEKDPPLQRETKLSAPPSALVTSTPFQE